MSQSMRRAPLAALLLTLAPIVAIAADECKVPVTAAEAEKAEDARYAAQTSNDFAAMAKLFGDDLVYVHSSSVVDDKTSYIESMRSGKTKYRVMKRSETKVRTYGCVALISGAGNFEVTSGGEDRTIPLRFLSVWVKRPAGLQFVSWESTRLPPAQ